MGKQHGEAIFTSAAGDSRKGIWEEGKRMKWVDGGSQGAVNTSVLSKDYKPKVTLDT